MKTKTNHELIKQVFDKCCELRELTPDEGSVRIRKRHIVLTRQIAMYYLKKNTAYSFAIIGWNCGKKDHATVMHAVNAIENQLDTDKLLRQEYQRIERELKLITMPQLIYNSNLDKRGFKRISESQYKIEVNENVYLLLNVTSKEIQPIIQDCANNYGFVNLRPITYMHELEELYRVLAGKELETIA